MSTPTLPPDFLTKERLKEIESRVQLFEDGAAIIHSEFRQCNDLEAYALVIQNQLLSTKLKESLVLLDRAARLIDKLNAANIQATGLMERLAAKNSVKES